MDETTSSNPLADTITEMEAAGKIGEEEAITRILFEDDLQVLLLFVEARLENIDIQLDTIEELRRNVVINTLIANEFPTRKYYVQRMIKELVNRNPRLATLEEVGIDIETVEQLKRVVWDIKLPLLEGQNVGNTSWEPGPDKPYQATSTYRPRIELLLTMQDIALHPGLIEVLLEEIHLRRREVGDAINEACRANCYSREGNDRMRKAARREALDKGFYLQEEYEEDAIHHHPVIEAAIQRTKAKKRGSQPKTFKAIAKIK